MNPITKENAMKVIFFALTAFVLSAPSFAARDIRCTATLLHPLHADGSNYLWTPPASETVVFDHDSQEEQIVYLKTYEIVPPNPNDGPHQAILQYSLERVENRERATLAVELSKTGYSGDPLPGNSYSLYLRTTKNWKDAFWVLAGEGPISYSRQVPVTETLNGYLSVSCVKK
jgi:hypothetical protein